MQSSAPGWPVVIALVASVACLVPLAVLVAQVVGRTWYPSGDRSLVELLVRDVGHDTRLVGPYSRYGWSHPGPAQYWLLAIPYRLTGSSSVSLLLATITVNAASIIGMIWVAWRRGRVVLAVLTAAVLSILLSSFGASFLVDPWNPFITVLPVGLFVMLVWADVDGERWALPAAVAVGSFVLQSHIGYAAIVGVGGMWVAVPRVRSWWRRGSGSRRIRRPTAVGWTAMAIGVVLWAPVVGDQLFGAHNLSELVSYFTSSGEPQVGPGYAAGVVAREVGVGAPWFSGSPEPVRIDGGVEATAIWKLWVVVGVLVISGGLAWWASRRTSNARGDAGAGLDAAGLDAAGTEVADAPDRRRGLGAARLTAVVLTMVLAGVVAVARITDVAFDYLVRWWWAIGAVTFVAVVWALWSALPVKAHRSFTIVAVALLGAVLAWNTVESVRAASNLEMLEPEFAGPISEIAGPTIEALPTGEPVRVASAGSGPGSVADGVRLQLERAGIPTLVSPDDGFKFGEHRSTGEVLPTATVWVVSGDELRSWMDRDDMAFVSLADPMSPDERDAWSADAATLADQFRAAGRQDLVDMLFSDESLFYASEVPGVDLDLLRRVDEGRRRGRPYAVFIGEPTDR